MIEGVMAGLDEKNECSHSGKLRVYVFRDTHTHSVPCRYATLITLPTLLPGVSSSLSE